MERLGGLGVHTLEELQTFTSRVTTAQRRKRHLAEGLPHAPGVYLFRDDRRPGPLRRHLARPAHPGALLLHRLRDPVADGRDGRPRRAVDGDRVRDPAGGRGARAAADRRAQAALQPAAPGIPEKVHFVKLTREPWPRLSLVRRVLDDDADYLGPFGSRRAAEKCLAALHETFPVRQCTDRLGAQPAPYAVRPGRDGPLPVALRRQRRRSDVRRRGRGGCATRCCADPTRSSTPLAARMASLADEERFEEAGPPPRPAGRVRPGRRAHPAALRADPLPRGGRRRAARTTAAGRCTWSATAGWPPPG